MTEEELTALKYPVGKFARGTRATTPERRTECIGIIDRFPQELRTALQGLSAAQLDTPYRPEGWTVRQLVHHIADSHGQTLHRFKLALTEDNPVIKPYKEALWAEHVDARTMPVSASLGIIDGTHARWATLMRGMSAVEFERAFVHPEQQREIALDEALELYVWHGRHHLRHITALKERMGWG
ncbi:MAG: putative metal-dependent hydrolase [Flavobacteriales bacterium]|nr:putative metal-dependent hydrolase [Flavobacteriales bacterium]